MQDSVEGTMPMNGAVLALNAGSSSIKFALFGIDPGHRPCLMLKGLLEDQGPEPRLLVTDARGTRLEDRTWPRGTGNGAPLGDTLDWVEDFLGTGTLLGVGHRIVHGGRDFAAPVRLDDKTIAAIDALTPLAPLHQPRSVAPIRTLRAHRPDLPQVGCFDTAFHHDLAPPVSRYAIPRRYEALGIRKYGFHGLSYAFIASQLAGIDPALPAQRTIVAHLGNGASLCAMQNGQSRDTTMGFSALDGLVMGTRPGALDPGVVLHLQQAHGLSAAEVEHLLYHESGLLGVSEIASDMRTLSGSDDPRAREAIDLFTFQIARQTAALANTIEGIDALVFTGGIGERAAPIRAAVCHRLAWLGISLDDDANDRHQGRISTPNSRVAAHIVATDEEIVIARHTLQLLRDQPQSL